VLCDRFTDATFAYQAGGSGLDWGRIEQLEAWVQGELQPHLTLYFDVPSQVGKHRTQSVRAPDRFESEGMAFFDRVRAGYLKRLKQFPHRMHLIDSTQSYDDVKVMVESIILSNCF
jgi:dTMP kinase